MTTNAFETFARSRFTYTNRYLTYTRENGEVIFIARFKWNPKRKAPFVRALIGNRVDDYLDRITRKPPVLVARDFGADI